MKKFFGLKNTPYPKAKYVILPVPYEATTTYGKGTKNGPAAIISASDQVELYDIELDIETYRIGINTAEWMKIKGKGEGVIKKIHSGVKRLLNDKKFPIVLGGEHSVSVGAVKAFREKYKNLSVLQFDAHSDLRDEYFGSKLNHGCVMRRVLEICPAVQVGIRSMDTEEARWAKRVGQWKKIFLAEEIPNPKFQKDILKQLTDQVYITIDVDVFDPGIMPSTGTPEPGGLDWYQVLDIIKAVIKEKQVVGFDVVELSPIKGLNAPDFMAAKLVYKLIGYLTKK